MIIRLRQSTLFPRFLSEQNYYKIIHLPQIASFAIVFHRSSIGNSHGISLVGPDVQILQSDQRHYEIQV